MKEENVFHITKGQSSQFDRHYCKHFVTVMGCIVMVLCQNQ